ncbi:MAG TPA: GNAT family protein [Ktedonobacterales bacterium]|jgi:RimJ/RimL family protein N-acetyltransferase
MQEGEFIFGLLSEADARMLLEWAYEGPYAVYNFQSDYGPEDPYDTLEELLDQRSPYYAVHDARGELVGFWGFGTSAEVTGERLPAVFREDGSLTVGLGLRPDLTGKGLGLAFVRAGLEFARKQFAPSGFRLFVLPWNERAMKVYERAGFRRVGTVMQKTLEGERPFVEMVREG